MAIGIRSRFTASVQGSMEKFVRCERCGRYFTYRLTRRVRASAVAPRANLREEAMLLAQQRASKALHDKLEHDIDLYPCPGCGFYQSDMTLAAKKRWLLGSMAIGGGITIAAGILPGLVQAMLHGGRFAPWMSGLIGGLAIAFVGSILAALADPNTGIGSVFSLGQRARHRPDRYSPPTPAAGDQSIDAAAGTSADEPLAASRPESAVAVTEEMTPPMFRPAIVVGPETLLVECARCGARHGLHTRFSGLRIRCRHCGELMDTTIAPAAEPA